MNVIFKKLSEVLLAVLPIVAIVTVLSLFFIPLDSLMIARFYIGAAFIVFGLTIFLIGIDAAFHPMGRELGVFIAKSNKIAVFAIGGLILGFIVSIAEPDLHILAEQVEMVTGGALAKMSIVWVVSIGVAVMVMLGLLRIVFNKPLKFFYLIAYVLILLFGIFSSSEFLAVSFDSSGATTGALTVPFILALAYGVSGLKKDSTSSEEDSFGLLGIASSGAILAVLILSVMSSKGEISGDVTITEFASGRLLDPFISNFVHVAGDSLSALLPIASAFFLVNALSIKVPKRLLLRITVGLVFVIVGLILFMLGVNAGFMEVGSVVGYKLVKMNRVYVLITSFFIGLVTILAEPAVYVLTKQIEQVTSGYVGRKSVLVALSLGVGMAIFLSILRILIPELQLWHFLLPGYALSLMLTFVVNPLFVGIAFDAGGVASGPMTATFILAFAHGVAGGVEGANVMADGFGIIAMVAMMPIISLQLLGVIFKIKSGKDISNEGN